jgi:hypothetical protein
MILQIPSKYKTNAEKLGYIGESIIAHHFDGDMSNDKFDQEKDIRLLDHRKVQVKTQNRHSGKNVFSENTMKKNAIENCMTVDRLIFVEYDGSSYIKIWECVDRESRTFYTTHYGDNMVGWFIDKMILLKTIYDKELAQQMRSYSQSREYSLNSPYAFNKF